MSIWDRIPIKLGKKRSVYLDENGKPKSIIATGKGIEKGQVTASSDRTESLLKSYRDYYEGENTVFAAINTTAWNSIMVGYSIISKDSNAKILIEEYLNRLSLDSVLLDSVIFALVYGDSFIEIIRNSKKDITGLKNVDPITMNILYDKYGTIEGYQQKIGGKLQDSVLNPEDIIHVKFFSKPSSPYGLSLIEPSKETIDRKVSTDESISNAFSRHGTPKYKVKVGTPEEIPPASVFTDIKSELEDISELNEIIIPGLVDIEVLDEKGVPGVEEMGNIFQTQLVIGMLCPEEALGLGKGILHPDTEILVKGKGYIPIYEVKENDIIMTYNKDTNSLEWQRNIKTWEYDLNEELFSIEAQTFNLLCTQDHRVLYRGQHKEDFEVCQAQELPSRFEMIVGGMNWNGEKSNYEIIPSVPRLYGNKYIEGKVIGEYEEKKVLIDTWLRFLGYYISEGSTTISKDGAYSIKIKQTKKDDLNKIFEDIKDLPFKINKYKDCITINDKQLGSYLSPLGKSYEKYIPEHIKRLPKEKLSILYDCLMFGDGCKNNYFTSSKQLADDVQEIILKMGYGSSIYTRDRIGHEVKINGKVTGKCNFIQYTVTRNEKNLTPEICIKDTDGHKDMHKLIPYEGKAYCVTVENGLILSRYNGKCVITGNSTEACNDKKTEVLTKDGWKNYWDLVDDDEIATFNPDTLQIEYAKSLESVDKYIYNHNGDMVHLLNDTTDILVTPNHRMYISLDKKGWYIEEAENLFNLDEFYVRTPESINLINKKDLSLEYYKGKVFSLNVPNHIYLTRRNNKVAIQGNTAKIKEVMYERFIKSIQTKLASLIRKELINKILEKNRFELNTVVMKFNSVTDADEAVKSKWLGNLLRGYPAGKQPFTINEVRAMFDYPPVEGGDELIVVNQPNEENEEKPKEEREESPLPDDSS